MGQTAMLTVGTVLLIAAVVAGVVGGARESATLEGVGLMLAVAGTVTVVTSSYVKPPSPGR